jgi:hypothetical protein
MAVEKKYKIQITLKIKKPRNEIEKNQNKTKKEYEQRSQV